jgi:hypothetical protein
VGVVRSCPPAFVPPPPRGGGGASSRPQAKSLQWSDFRREGHESYARMARRSRWRGRPHPPQPSLPLAGRVAQLAEGVAKLGWGLRSQRLIDGHRALQPPPLIPPRKGEGDDCKSSYTSSQHPRATPCSTKAISARTKNLSTSIPGGFILSPLPPTNAAYRRSAGGSNGGGAVVLHMGQPSGPRR